MSGRAELRRGVWGKGTRVFYWAVAGALAWSAMAQEPEGGFILKVNGVAKPMSPVVEVEVWAWFEEGPQAVAFAGAALDLHADDVAGRWIDFRCEQPPNSTGSWCGATLPTLAGSRIEDITVGQVAFPPIIMPTTENPVHVFTGFWVANDYSPRTVRVETLVDRFGVYDSNYGSRLLQHISPGVGEIRVCYADCDENGVLDFFDFLCFQNAFLRLDPYADCDGNGVFDFFDFLCFQNQFIAGCP
jgi:hypothetical protein